MKKFFKDFKAFISRGNILDMAVGVIIGGAFSAIVTALTNKIIMPLINLIVFACTGGSSITLISILNGQPYLVDDGAGNMILNPECIFIDWGSFIIAIIDFLLIAIVLFMIIKAMMSAQGLVQKNMKEKPTKEEKKELKAQGVDMKNKKTVKVELAKLRESKKAPAPAPIESTNDILNDIRELLREQKAPKGKKTTDAE